MSLQRGCWYTSAVGSSRALPAGSALLMSLLFPLQCSKGASELSASTCTTGMEVLHYMIPQWPATYTVESLPGRMNPHLSKVGLWLASAPVSPFHSSARSKTISVAVHGVVNCKIAWSWRALLTPESIL